MKFNLWYFSIFFTFQKQGNKPNNRRNAPTKKKSSSNRSKPKVQTPEILIKQPKKPTLPKIEETEDEKETGPKIISNLEKRVPEKKEEAEESNSNGIKTEEVQKENVAEKSEGKISQEKPIENGTKVESEKKEPPKVETKTE